MQVPEVLKRVARPILRRTLYAQSVYRPVEADRPFYIRLDITNTCNQACIKCWYPDYAKQGHPVQQMAVADFERLAERLFPYAHFLQIPFAFEALTHPQFARLARIADSYGIPDMGVVTNGTLLCGDKAEALIESRNFMAVNVSLDGVRAETYARHRGRAQLGVLLRNIDAFQRRKRELGKEFPHLKINCVMTRSNVGELPEIARWCVRNGVDEAEFFHVEPYELQNEESLLHTPEAYNRVHDEIGQVLRGSGVRIFLPPPYEAEDFDPQSGAYLRRYCQGVRTSPFDTSGTYEMLPPPEGMPGDTICINPWMVLVIDAWGNLRPCSHRGALPPFANILQQELESAVNSIRILKLRRGHQCGKHDDLCAGCKSKTPNSDPMKWRHTRRLEPLAGSENAEMATQEEEPLGSLVE